MASNQSLTQRSKDEHDFWDAFWLHSETLVRCEKCLYVKDCLAVPKGTKIWCGQFLEKKYRDFLGVEDE